MKLLGDGDEELQLSIFHGGSYMYWILI
jgi:hypothetical protein